jgi:chromosome segregation ATPase
VSGVIHSSSVMHEIDEEDGLIIKELREELINAKKETEDVSQLLQRTLAEVEDLHEQNNELNTHIDQNAARIAELDEELAHSDHHIDNLEARIHILEQEKAEFQQQVKDLTDVVDAASIASRLAAEQKQELIEKYTQQINELETKLNQTLSDAESRLENSNSSNNTLANEKTRLAEELATALSTMSRLENENLELTRDKQNLEESLQLNETRQGELLVELSTLRGKYDEMKSSEREVQGLLEIAKDRVIQAELAAERNQEAYQAASQEVLDLGEQIERIKWRSKEEIDEWSNRISQLEKELEISQAEAAATKELLLKEHEAQVLSTMEQLQQEITHLKELLVTAEGQQQELSQQLLEKNEEKSAQAAELMKQIETLSQELEGRSASSASQTLVIESLQADLLQTNSQRQQFEEKYSILEKELMKNREELQSLSKRNAELEEFSVNSSKQQQQSQQESSLQLNQSLERALQDLREERERFDNYRTKRDEESLALHKQIISSNEKMEVIQKQNREMAENVELERKNRNAILQDSQQELQETQRQLTEALKKISQFERQRNGSPSRRHSRVLDDHDQDDIFGTDDEGGGDSGELTADHAVHIVKYHRDLAVARAEIADLAQQLVESAHREDDMQQCITDLQQEISIVMSHMTQLQQQQQLQGHATSLRQSTSTLLSERNAGSSPSKASGIAGAGATGGGSGGGGYEIFPNYELIEKYKQLYNETLDRCQALETEIIEEKELMNEKVYLLTSSLHDEINQAQHENMELKRELFEMRQQLQTCQDNLLKKKTLEMKSATVTATSNEMLEKYKGMYLQTLERCQSLENEVIQEKEEISRKYLGVIDELTEELALVKDENMNSKNEVMRLQELLKIASQENEILKGNEAMTSKELQDTKQQLRIIKSTFHDIAKPLNRLLSQDEQPTGLSES